MKIYSNFRLESHEKILVKTEENKWEEFRDFFIKIGSKFSFKWTHNDLTKKVSPYTIKADQKICIMLLYKSSLL